MDILWQTCRPAQFTYHILTTSSTVFVITLMLALVIKRLRPEDRKFALSLFFYHYIFAFLYLSYAQGVESWRVDSMKFFTRSCLSPSFIETYGTAIKSISFSIYPLNTVLNFNFLSISLIYAFIGYLGLLLCWLAIRRYLTLSDRYSTVLNFIFFWPSLHFWSATIGKDSWSILCMGLIMIATLNWSKYKLYVFASLIVILHVRPYLFFIFMVAFVISYTFSNNRANFLTKIFVFLLISALAIPAAGFFKEHLRIEEIGMTALEERYNDRLDRQIGSSYVDLRSYNLAEKTTAFMFRPLFFDATSSKAVLASVENAILLVFTLYILLTQIPNLKIVLGLRSFFVRFIAILYPITLIFMSNVTPNLGAAFRKKYLVLIPLAAIISIVLSKYRKQNNET